MYPIKKIFKWALQGLLISVIRFYQLFISPLKPPTCRFTPSCSSYSLQAIARFGPVYGGYLSAHRICRCHPWGGSGWDPVPLYLWKKMIFYPFTTQQTLYNVPFLFKVRP